jgi:hypothetical protein
MTASEAIGNINVDIIGDWSDLQTAIDQATSASQAGAEQISSAFTSAASDAGNLGSAAEEASPKLADLGASEHGAAESAAEAAGGLKEMAEQLTLLGESLAITEGIKEFGDEALSTYAEVEKVSISLTALTGSADLAEASIERMKELAMSDALSFPSLLAADQKMTAFGFTTEQTEASLKAIADVAGATGKDFESVADTFDRMVLSGTANARMLAGLGINTTILGEAMGVSANEAAKVYKALDMEDRITALTEAFSKFGGVAQAQAQGLSGQWQNFKTQFELVAEDVGKALLPLAQTFLDTFQRDIIPAIKSLIEQWQQLPEPVKDAALAFGAIAIAIPPVTAAISGVMLSLNALRGILPAVTELMYAFGASETAANAAAGLLGPLLIGIGGAWLATQKQLSDLNEKYKDFNATQEETRQQAIRDMVAHGMTLEQFGQMSISADQVKAAMGGVKQSFGEAQPFITSSGLGLHLVGMEAATAGGALRQHAADAAAAIDAEKKLHDALVPSIAQLKELGLLGAEDPFKTLDASAQKLFDDFLRGFEGMDTEWNATAAGMKPDKLLADFEKLRAEMVQGSAQGTLGWIQVNDAIQMLGKYIESNLSPIDEKVSDQIQRNNDKIIASVDKVADHINAIPHIMDGVIQAMTQIQTETDKTQTKYHDLRDAVEEMGRLGLLNVNNVTRAMSDLISAAKQAGVDTSTLTQTLLEAGIPAEQLDLILQQLAKDTDKFGSATENTRAKGRDMAQEISRTIETDLSRALSDVIFQTGKISDAFIKMGKDVVDIILNHIIKLGLDPLLSKLDDVFSKIGLGGGGGGGGGGGVSVGGGGGMGGLGAIGGAMGMVGAVGSAVGAVSGIISNFQMAHQTDILRSIELNTRLTATFIGGLGGGGVQDWLQAIAVNTTPLLSINTWIHDSWVELLSDAGSIKAALTKGTGNITININGAGDPQAVAQAVANYLKNTSPSFSP